jgi:arylsulfatase A-like enzyme
MDAELSRITERLAELGLSNDAVVVVTSDHGEEFHDHGGVFHGGSLYAEMIRVPLVVWGPSFVQSGTRVDTTVQSVDIMPTLLQLSGIPAPPGMQGRSLVDLLSPSLGEAPEPRDAFAEKAVQSEGPFDVPRAGVESTAIVSGRWKLVHNTRGPENLAEVELFDREADPTEAINVAEAYPDEVERLMTRLSEWRAEVAANPLAPDSDPEALTPGELERLRALGYAD